MEKTEITLELVPGCMIDISLPYFFDQLSALSRYMGKKTLRLQTADAILDFINEEIKEMQSCESKESQ